MVMAVSEGKCKIEIKLYVWDLTYYIIMCGTCTGRGGQIDRDMYC